ncbi:MAG: 3D domain-containing protein [Acidaminococcaceae bacterium]
MDYKTILNRPYKMLIMGLLLLFTMCLLGFAASERQVSVCADGRTVTFMTRAFSPSSVLAEAGIVLGEQDGYIVADKTKLTTGSLIEVVRAMPIKVWQDGKTTEYTIGRGTVREVLTALNYEYRDKEVYPALDTRPTPGMEINILGPHAKVQTEKRTVAFTVERRLDEHLPIGEEKVIAQGKAGEQVVTMRIATIGERIFKREVGVRTTVQPQTEIVAVGTGRIVQTSRGAVRYRSVKTMEASAYTLAEGNGDGVTSIGIVPYHGIIAVDPDVIAYGTRVYIPGYGFAMAGDCGGAIVGNRIDLFMENYHDAINFGRRDVAMYILE